jgi:hypothetical protein
VNISNMHRARPCFNCEPVAVDQHETFVDPDLGSITTGPMPEPVEAEPVTIEHDVDLGPIVLGRSPAMPGNPRRTLAPPFDTLFAAYVLACALCIALNGIVAFTALAAGR